MADRFSCAELSATLDESPMATASQVRRWILVEQPGPWGADAVMQSMLDVDLAMRLCALARGVRARLLLIRRHGRSDPTQRRCLAVTSTADVRRVERFDFTDPAELLTIDWSPLATFAPVGGAIVDDPLFLVCTNGRHDVCCARFGRPVAQALEPELGDQLWEASHFGGDRFAGNLVCLPDGIYYGRVTPSDAPRLVGLHGEGRLDLAHYRGRSFQPFVAQAAEHFAREQLGLLHIDEILADRVDDVGAGLFEVALRTADGRSMTGTVQASVADEPHLLTCRSSLPAAAPRYRLVDLR